MEPTPLEPAPWDESVLLKREDTHELGAFKWRGALAVLEAWRTDVVTASTGNHGAAARPRGDGLRAGVGERDEARHPRLGRRHRRQGRRRPRRGEGRGDGVRG